MEKFKKGHIKNLFVTLIISLVILVSLNLYLLFRISNKPANKSDYYISNVDQKIKDLEGYLDAISPAYIVDEQLLAHQNDLPSWGCGPSSYALAKIINKKFFNDQLPIYATYNNKDSYQIIERFGLAQNGKKIIDHAWLEIYFGDKFLFVDPSIGQFGKINKIAYRVFNVGESDIQDTLKKEYNIEDVRLSLLVPKVINRIPIDQDPYPGMTIEQQSIGYFLKVVEDRNNVNDGIEPAEWKDWVSSLTEKYLN